MQTSGNHQMQDQPEVIFESECDPFANAAKRNNLLSFAFRDWWNGGPKEKGAADTNASKRLAGNTTVQSIEINRDVWQLRHKQRIGYFAKSSKKQADRGCVGDQPQKAVS
jgi:hypothetical protein